MHCQHDKTVERAGHINERNEREIGISISSILGRKKIFFSLTPILYPFWVMLFLQFGKNIAEKNENKNITT